ncbi:hypothetical protein KR018_012039 [Drosophila ironensis]|nr:hypothetical protein KR018_012039 [Drosophila ironensis]
MAGKRQATSNLNHDNWDQEDEPEERGYFRMAAADEISTRVIKKARRKVPDASNSSSSSSVADTPQTKSVFSGFSGFSKPATGASTSAGSPFAFLAKIPQACAATSDAADSSAAKTASSSTTSDVAKPLFPFLGSQSSKKSAIGNDVPKPSPSPFGSTSDAVKASSSGSIFGPKTDSPKEDTSLKASSSSSSVSSSGSCSARGKVSYEFRENVAQLNREIVKFLKDQVDGNAYCDLNPIFKAYDKHLKDLWQEEKGNKPKEPTTPTKVTTTPSKVATTPTKVTTMPTKVATTSTVPTSFSFGKSSTSIGGSLPMFGKKPNCTVTSGGTTTTTITPLFGTSTSGGTTTTTITPLFGTSTSGGTTTNTIKPLFGTSTSSIPFSGFGTLPATAAPASSSSEAKTELPKPGFFSLNVNKKDDTVTSPPKTNGFNFSLKSDDKPSGSLFSGFGKASDGAGDLKATTGFVFTPGSTPFSFGNIKPPPPSATPAAGEDGDEADEPPKVEFKQVVEDDAVFSKRCKVFIKKDKDFCDRGVGTLYLKPVKDSEKTQMLVRADTNLGNILVNLILSEGIPCQRMGKNNVMLVCVPTPEEQATSLLIRVKTGEEADEVLEQIKKHIK